MNYIEQVVVDECVGRESPLVGQLRKRLGFCTKSRDLSVARPRPGLFTRYGGLPVHSNLAPAKKFPPRPVQLPLGREFLNLTQIKSIPNQVHAFVYKLLLEALHNSNVIHLPRLHREHSCCSAAGD